MKVSKLNNNCVKNMLKSYRRSIYVYTFRKSSCSCCNVESYMYSQKNQIDFNCKDTFVNQFMKSTMVKDKHKKELQKRIDKEFKQQR